MKAFDSFAVCSSKNKDSALQRSFISRVVEMETCVLIRNSHACTMLRCLSHSSEAPQAANVLLAIFKSAGKRLTCPAFLLPRFLRRSETETDVTSTARPSQHRRKQ